MAKITIGLGVLLISIGLYAYLVLAAPAGDGAEAGGRSLTALIPAFLGLPLAVLGAVALRPGARKHAMHAAAMVGLLGLMGTVPGLLKLPALLSGGELDRPSAVAVQSIVAGLCAVFLVLCVRSFIAARRAAASSA